MPTPFPAERLMPVRSGTLIFRMKHCDRQVRTWYPVREPMDPAVPGSPPVLRIRGEANCCDAGVPGASKLIGHPIRDNIPRDGESLEAQSLYGRTKTYCEICEPPCWVCGPSGPEQLRSEVKGDICVNLVLAAEFQGFGDCCEMMNGYVAYPQACGPGPSGGPGGADYCHIARPWIGGVAHSVGTWSDTGTPTGTMQPIDISDCPIIGTPEIGFGGAGVRIASYCIEDPSNPATHPPYAWWDIFVRMRLPCAWPGTPEVCCTFQSHNPPSGLRGCSAYAGCILVPLGATCGYLNGESITAMLECVSGADPGQCTMELVISDGGAPSCPQPS